MMDEMHYPILTKVLEVIRAANESQDCLPVRRKALDALYQSIRAEGAIFFLPDGNGRFTDTILKNLEESYNENYKEYYHQFDPLQLVEGPLNGEYCQYSECAISYDAINSTEYYADFLKPQKIHHKLIVNLTEGRKLYGKIVLTRPKGLGVFTHNEICTAKMIAPYLTHALAHSDLRKKLALRESIINYIEKEAALAIILFDQKLRVIYKNHKAAELFDKLLSLAVGADDKERIFSQLIQDCRQIKSIIDNCPEKKVILTKQRIVKIFNQASFSVSSRLFIQESEAKNNRFFMVCIEELISPIQFNRQHVMDLFHLSKREIDVAALLFSGLTNARIAEKLFISEITVKKHLQNIYAKVGVGNRTSLINKILTH